MVEDHVETFAEPGDEKALRLAVLQYSREIAFATAHVYASFAENRGAWDARLEALVVDALVRGERPTSLPSRAAALGWAAMTPVAVVVGAAPAGDPEQIRTRCSGPPGRRRCEVLVGVHADQLVVVLGGVADAVGGPPAAAADEFGAGPVVIGPTVDDLGAAGESAAAALAGLRAARAWPDAPRPVPADDLLPERALDGDPLARAALRRRRLPAAGRGRRRRAGDRARRTRAAAATWRRSARAIFVHPNTVRYRLKRAAELTGLPATDPRGSWTLQVALALAELDRNALALSRQDGSPRRDPWVDLTRHAAGTVEDPTKITGVLSCRATTRRAGSLAR